jgi:HlyD family secretion protein
MHARGNPVPDSTVEPVSPPPPPPSPKIVLDRRRGPSRGRWVAGIAATIAVIAGAVWYGGKRGEGGGSQGMGPAFRTFAVVPGKVDRTLRITGATAAERYVSLIAPQMRGSRSGFGRGGSNISSRSSSASTVTSYAASAGTSVSSTSSAASATSSLGGGGGAGGSVESSAGSAAGAQSRGTRAMSAATSRVSRTESRPRGGGGGRGSSGGGASQAAAAMGAQGLGSTAESLPGGSSGPPSVGGTARGGRGDFSLVLQEVARSGVHIRKGDVVAEFDRQYMLLRLDDYRDTVSQSASAVKALKADLEAARKAHQQTIDVAKADLEKARLDMQTIEVASAIDAERLRLNLEEAQARLKQLEAEVKHFEASQRSELRNAELQLKQAELELRRAEANADRMLLKAPIDGLVVMQSTFRGGEFDQIKQGDQLFPGQPFMQIVDPSSMIINATVNQADVERLRIGQKARVRFDAFPDLELPARVHAIGTVAKSSRFRADWVKEMAVSLKLEQMDPRVIPDLSVSADVLLESGDGTVLVPREAITQDADGRASVWVRSGNRWDRREVELGLISNTKVAIQSGLREGEVVALETPTAAQPERKETN